jgi:hypothetical protein
MRSWKQYTSISTRNEQEPEAHAQNMLETEQIVLSGLANWMIWFRRLQR